MKYVIQNDVPMPNNYRNRNMGKTEFLKILEVGQSFVDEDATKTSFYGWHHIAKTIGMKVSIRKEETGYRVWRIA